MTQNEKLELLQQQHEVVLKESAYLNETDYVAAKIAEGSATKTEYKSVINERRLSRERINAAQAEIERLNSIEPEDEPRPMED